MEHNQGLHQYGPDKQGAPSYAFCLHPLHSSAYPEAPCTSEDLEGSEYQ